MAIFDIPTFSNLLTEVLAKIKEKRPNAATGPGSDADIQSWTLAHLAHGLHIHLRYGVLWNLIPTKAAGWALDAWAWLFGLSNGSGGYGRILARGSSADDSFTFVADTGPGWVDLDGSTFIDSAGQRFQVDESYTPIAAGVTPALNVIALDTGAATNLETWQSETFTWETTPTQMTKVITQVLDLDGGADEETDSELRARLATHLQTPAMGGNWASWKEIAEESSPGNVDAWVWEGQHNSTTGYACTDIACTQRGEDGAAKNIESTDALYDTIDDALIANVMYGALFRVRFLDSNAEIEDVELTITLNDSATQSQRCDWDAEAWKMTVSARSEANKTITSSKADITDVISVGDRVIIYSAQAVVAKVGIAGGLAADSMFEVDSWFTAYDEDTNPFPWTSTFDPSLSNIQAGGGLILEGHEAIRKDVFRPLGPHRGSAGTSAPMPGWEHILRLQNIQAAMIGVGDTAGNAVIIDATISTPPTDQAPVTGYDTDVYFQAPGEITIWEAK